MDVTISEAMVPYLYTVKDGNTVAEKVNISLILGLFVSKAVTLEKAAELAGKSVWDFVEVLKGCRIPWGEYTDEDAAMDAAALDKLEKGLYE